MRKVLAVDIGGSKVLCGLVDEDGTAENLCGEELPPSYGRDAVLDAVVRCGRRAADGASLDGVGATIPGLADPDRGVWVYAPFSGIADWAIAEELSTIFGAPASIENDVNACALAEMRFGACRDEKDFLWVTISNGVGGAVVAGGRLLRGTRGNAGEVGHLIVEEDEGKARRCGCGRRGCLEAMAAGPGIAARYGVRGVSAKAVAERARAGDARAAEVMRQTGFYLGKGLAACATLLNLARIVLGGGVSQSMELFLPSLREAFDSRVFAQGNPSVEIVPTVLGTRAGLLGAAGLALGTN